MLLHGIVHHLLAQPAAWLLAISSDAAIVADGNAIRTAAGSALVIIRGCDGSSSMFLLLAGIFAFRASGRHRLAGACIGLSLLHTLNIARVVVLFVLLQRDAQLFETMHEYVAPVLTVFVACAYYALWCSAARVRASPSAAVS